MTAIELRPPASPPASVTFLWSIFGLVSCHDGVLYVDDVSCYSFSCCERGRLHAAPSSILLFNRSGTLSLFPLSQPLADSCTCSCGMSYGPRAQDGRDGLERIIAASGCLGLPCMVSSHSSRAMRWDEHPTYGWQKQPIGNTRLGAYISCMLSVGFDSTVVSSPPVIPSSRSHQALPSQSAVQGQHVDGRG